MSDLYGQAVVVAEHPGREEWLELRKRGVGGSDVAAILGLDPYTSNVACWASKLNKVTDTSDTESAAWGRRLEAVVAEEAAERLGLTLHDPQGALLAHPEHPWMLATPDRIAEKDGQVGVLEVKTTSAYLADDWSDGATPDRAALQLHHYLAVTGHRVGWIAALIGGQRLEVREVEYNPALGESLIAAEADFWHLVETGVMPAPLDGSGSTSDTLAALFAQIDRADECHLPPEAYALWSDLLEAKAAVGESKAEADRLANELKALLLAEGAEVGLLGGQKAVSWKTQTTRRVAVSKVKDAHPDDWFDRFGEETESRVFRTHTMKEETAA